MAVLGYPKALSWANFGTPKNTVPSSYTGSHTDCHIEIDINASFTGPVPESPGGDYMFKNVNVTVKINALKSWVLKGVNTSSNQAAILKHEQGHYDIAGITATDIEGALTGLRNSDANQLKADANKTISDWLSAGQTEEDTYDGDVVDGGTDHGNDVTQQAAWNSKIAAATSLNDLP